MVRQIKAAIDEAEQLFVFWCCHSARSAQVRREVNYALSRKKRTVPCLIDNTPPPKKLKPIRAVSICVKLLLIVIRNSSGRVEELLRDGRSRKERSKAPQPPQPPKQEWSEQVRRFQNPFAM
jgi:hypothetical protein